MDIEGPSVTAPAYAVDPAPMGDCRRQSLQDRVADKGQHVKDIGFPRPIWPHQDGQCTGPDMDIRAEATEVGDFQFSDHDFLLYSMFPVAAGIVHDSASGTPRSSEKCERISEFSCSAVAMLASRLRFFVPYSYRNFSKSFPLPPLGHAVLDFDMFMAGEAEVDEPLFVQKPRSLLQQLNPPPVVFDEVVVGGEDGGDTSLDISIWIPNQHCMQVIAVYSRYSSFVARLASEDLPQKVRYPSRVVSLEVQYVQSSIEWPEVFRNVEYFPKRTVSTSNDARGLHFRLVVKTSYPGG